MKKRLLSCLLAISVITTTALPCVAFDDESDSCNYESEAAVEDANNEYKDCYTCWDTEDGFVEDDNVVELDLEEDTYEWATELADMEIPIEAEEEICLENGAVGTIEMQLPEGENLSKGEVINDGTIVYKSIDETFKLGVQGIENADDASIGMRSLIEIENKDAPKRYSFEFTLPENCKLVEADDYTEETESDSIYIVKETEEDISSLEYPISEIDSPWAKDANGNDVPTHYEIEEDTLIQVIEFTDETEFPVVADPQLIVGLYTLNWTASATYIYTQRL